MTAEPHSVGEWLKIAITRLHAVSQSPQLDAEILLQAITGIHRSRAYARPEQALEREQIEDLQPVLARRERGEPIAYIVGQQEFWSMPLQVSAAVLIPRPETELLVERALELVPLNTPSRVLDLGTGSGAIALAIAHARPHAHVVAADVSHDALTVAGANRRKFPARNLELKHSDWFAAFDNAPEADRFDVIVSNPPYIAEDDPHLSLNVATFEPKIALIAGPTGLEAIERIVRQSGAHLKPNGWLAMEHGWRQASTVAALLVQHGFSHVRSRPDLAGHDRITEGQAPGALR
ncbi:MAG TPA: peptide chain release factor N(5)-glutamine methyltransferase [Steroidobacteraceae bacterium]|nr:peptide chain release factor N(5)-glutamine methyltransferase [Steroidobacteraceae bacterium]